MVLPRSLGFLLALAVSVSLAQDRVFLRRRQSRGPHVEWLNAENQEAEASVESPLFLTRGGVVEQQQQLSQQQQQLVPPPTREDETGEKNLVHWRRRVKKVKKVPPPLQWRRKVLKRRQRPLRSQPLPSSNEVRTAGANATSLSERERDARFFSLFTIVRFANDACATSNSQNGTCYTSADCSARGGRSDGTCAAGFGVCCFFEFQCGQTTSENGTYFINPSTPERICNLMINRLNDDICQVRLELDTFDISGPNTDGDCQTDFFLVTGGSQVPQICGLNSGQHIIYSITSNSGPTQLSVVLDTTVTATATRQWNIRVLQYECSSRNLAPVGCLQYFEATSGEISSFNYRPEVDGTTTNQLASMNYAICIRPANGFCGVRYSQISTDPFSFTLSGDAVTTPELTFPLPTAGVMFGDVQCSQDYLVIPGASEDGTLLNARDRYCGITLGPCMAPVGGGTGCMAATGPVTTFSRPFVVQVVTDETELTTEEGNRGFRLNFNQQPCLSGK